MFRIVALSVAALVVSAAACGPALAQQGDVFASGGQARGADCAGAKRTADDQSETEYETALKGCGNAGSRLAASDAYQQRGFEILHDYQMCEDGNKKTMLKAQISTACEMEKAEADLDAEIAKTQAEKACYYRDGVCNMAPMKPFEDKRRANLAAYSICLKRVGPPSAGPYLGRTPLPGDTTVTPGVGKPDAARLKAVLTQLDDMIGRAANYQPPLSGKFLITLAKDLRNDLDFLAQRPYVPAAQIANSLHTGLWSYLTGNAYENNTALPGGVANAVSRTAQLIAQEPEAALAELTHFLLVTKLTGGPGEGAAGSQLAAKAEQSAGILQKLEGEVTRRAENPRTVANGARTPGGKSSSPFAGWVRQFYRDIELQLPREPLQPGVEPLYPVQPPKGGCGQYSCSSVLNKFGLNVNVVDLMKQLPADGTFGADLVDLFAKNGVTAYATKRQTIANIQNWFSQPHSAPVIASFGDSASAHWVEITGLSTNSQRLPSFNITDPAGFAYTKPIASFEPFFRAHGGQVIYVAGPLGR